MGDFSDRHNLSLILNSERGIAFEEGFKRELADILNLPFKEKTLYRVLPENDRKLYAELGSLVAKVHFKSLEGKPLEEVAELSFNEGRYPLGDYRNADFFAVFENKAVFAELTKEGDPLSPDDGRIYSRSEVSLSITQAVSFEEYFTLLLEKAKNLYGELPVRAYGELKKILQVLTYSADFLLKRGKPFDLSVMVLYPVKDAFYTHFEGATFGNENLLKEAKKLLRELRAERKIEVNFEGGERTFKPPYPINEVRKSVEEFLREKSKRGTAVVLLHAPASGKTTATLNFVKELSETKPVFFCYFTTRIAVAQSVADKLKEMGFRVLSSAKRKYRKTKSQYAKYLFLEKAGNLSLLKGEMLRLRELPEKLAVSTTFHSLVKTKYGNTVKHLLSMLKLFLRRHPNGEIVIGIDEITGADRSFSSYRDLLKALKGENLTDKVRIIVFDASLYSGEVFKREFELKVKTDRGIPPHLTYSRYSEADRGVIEEIEHFFGFKPAYPAKSLKVVHRELFIEKPKKEGKKGKNRETLLAERLSSLLASLSREGGVGLYIQSINLLRLCSLKLREKGIFPVVVHSLNKPKIEEVKGKVFLFTSALSRGIDLPVKHFFVVVPSFEIEQNLAEILQVFYRLRDGKTDGETDKEITALYPVYEGDNHSFTRLKNEALKNLIDELLEAYIEPKRDKLYPIPLPAVKESKFHNTLLSYAEILRQVSLYVKLKGGTKEIEPEIKIEGWTKLSEPKIYYPFAVFPKADLKVRIKLTSPKPEAIAKRLSADRFVPDETKRRLLEFLEGFDENGELYLNTSSPFAIFLPNLVIPTETIKDNLEKIGTITRLGYGVHNFKVFIDNRLFGEEFEVKHGQDLIAFFPQEEIEEFLTLPQIPLVFFAGKRGKT